MSDYLNFISESRLSAVSWRSLRTKILHRAAHINVTMLHRYSIYYRCGNLDDFCNVLPWFRFTAKSAIWSDGRLWIKVLLESASRWNYRLLRTDRPVVATFTFRKRAYRSCVAAMLRRFGPNTGRRSWFFCQHRHLLTEASYIVLNVSAYAPDWIL